jgi:hypothetical protein
MRLSQSARRRRVRQAPFPLLLRHVANCSFFRFCFVYTRQDIDYRISDQSSSGCYRSGVLAVPGQYNADADADVVGQERSWSEGRGEEKGGEGQYGFTDKEKQEAIRQYDDGGRCCRYRPGDTPRQEPFQFESFRRNRD